MHEVQLIANKVAAKPIFTCLPTTLATEPRSQSPLYTVLLPQGYFLGDILQEDVAMVATYVATGIYALANPARMSCISPGIV